MAERLPNRQEYRPGGKVPRVGPQRARSGSADTEARLPADRVVTGMTPAGRTLFRRHPSGLGVLLDRHTPVDAILLRRIIAGGLMIRTAVVPDHDIADMPLVTILSVRLHHIGLELGDQVIAFGLFRALHGKDLARVEIQ